MSRFYISDEDAERQACESWSRQYERHIGPEKARHPDAPYPYRNVSCRECQHIVCSSTTKDGVCNVCRQLTECQACKEIVPQQDITAEGTCLLCEGRNSADAAESRMAG